MTTCIHCGEWFEGGSTGERPVCVKCNSSFAFPPTQPRPTPKPTPVSDPTFDPYYNWLGIPPARQPPNLYQLLGLTELETNQDVIATAADRQSAHLRSFLGGQQALDAERLLAEVEAARVCLLNEHTKSAYDSVLSLAVPSQMPSQFGTTPSPAVPVLQLANPASTNAAMPSLLVGPVKSANDHTTASQPSASLPIRRRPAKPQRSPLRQVIQIVLGGIAGCAIGYYLGFVLLPSIRARSAASTPRPPAELVIRQSPTRPSNQSPPRQQVAEEKPSPLATPPPRRPANSTTNSSSPPRTVPAPPVSRQPPQQQPYVSTSPPPRSTPSATPPRTLADLAPRSAATPPTSLFPAFVALPKRTTSLSQPLMSIPKTIELTSPRLLTDAAPLQEGEYLYLEELKAAGVRAWTVNAAIPGDAGDDSPREIGEFSERNGELAFRWFSNASAEHEALLLNSLFKFSDDAQQPTVALREPLKVEPLQIDTNERRATQSFGLGGDTS